MSDRRVHPSSDPYSPSPSPRGAAPADEIPSGLSDPSETTFLRALGRLSSRPREVAAAVGFLNDFVLALLAESRLTDRTRADRMTAVLRRLAPSSEVLAGLAAGARAYPAGMRMAVSQALPPEHRALLAPTPAPAPETGPTTEAPVAESPAAGPSGSHDQAPTAEEGQRASNVRLRDEGAPPPVDDSIGMVAILTRPDLQDANKRLLREHKFAALPWDSVERLRAELSTNSDVCACVIDGSILADLDEDAQRSLFTFLGRYSSFLWVRIHEHGLRLTVPEVRELVKQARCARGTVAHVTFQADSKLRPSELDDFRRSAETLQASVGAAFVPGELDEEQVRVLVAAVREYWNAHHLGSDVHVRVLETRFIPGGRSGAVLIRIRVNGTGQPLIAKLGPTDWIVAESRRLRTFVEQWERAVHPETFLHGACGVILFPLVANGEERDAPADTLEERLVDLWNSQVMGAGDGSTPESWEAQLVARRDSMVGSLRVLATTLASLNQQRPANTATVAEFPPVGNPWLHPLTRLAAEGVEWRFPLDFEAARSRAQERFARLEVQAVVHGDMHLRNVLLRSERDATLIDFAGCGPGHPAVDLARLDVLLFTDGMRQLVSEQRCVEFQHGLSIQRASAATLRSTFSDLLACHANVVCAEGAVLARESAMSVLQTFGGTYDDFLAVKFLIASQSLLQMGRSTAMARAIVAALAPTILAWPPA